MYSAGDFGPSRLGRWSGFGLATAVYLTHRRSNLLARFSAFPTEMGKNNSSVKFRVKWHHTILKLVFLVFCRCILYIYFKSNCRINNSWLTKSSNQTYPAKRDWSPHSVAGIFIAEGRVGTGGVVSHWSSDWKLTNGRQDTIRATLPISRLRQSKLPSMYKDSM